MKFYADSGFLVSCYLADSNTPIAKAWLLKARAPLPFTDRHLLEVPTALRLAVFHRLILQAQADALMAGRNADLLAGRLVKSPVDWPAAFRSAARLSESYSAGNGSRSLDILHVAAAKMLHASEFVSFDARQIALAKLAGLTVAP